jgi:DNA helicase-2/ATP-dependent DNA helicase PcrA
MNLQGPEVHSVPAPPPPLGVYAGCLPVAYVAPASIQLDPFQRAVVDWTAGEAVVPAAAGAGKTTTLVERTATLLALGEVPESILLLVYNRDAADAIRERLKARLHDAGTAARVNVFTFHAWCYALLRHWYPTQARLAQGHILETPGAPHPVKLVEPLLKDLKIDLAWRDALQAVERLSEALINPEDFDVGLAGRALHLKETRSAHLAELLRPYMTFAAAWQRKKREDGWVQFSDMIYEVAQAMAQHPSHLGYLRTIYRHVMVDEAQDASRSRASIAEFLGLHAASLLWVGDPAQSIYEFSAADPQILLDIAARATVLRMPVNRRSTERIVQASNEIVRGQPWAIGGDAVARPGAPAGEPVQVWDCETPQAEAERIFVDIQRRARLGLPLGTKDRPNYCCLARTNAMLVELESAFVARGLPVQISGCPGGLWGSSIGKELLAYLEAVEGVPAWSLLDIANQPLRYAAKADLRGIISDAQAREKQGYEVALHDALRASPSRGVQRLGRELAEARLSPWPDRVDACRGWLRGKAKGLEGGEDRAAALEAIGALARQLGSLAAVYEYKRAQQRGEQEPAVLLSTIHGAKGLEWPVVYLTGVRSQKLPHQRCVSEDEELRLLYVGCTRARDALVITTGGPASKFLKRLKWPMS